MLPTSICARASWGRRTQRVCTRRGSRRRSEERLVVDAEMAKVPESAICRDVKNTCAGLRALQAAMRYVEALDLEIFHWAHTKCRVKHVDQRANAAPRGSTYLAQRQRLFQTCPHQFKRRPNQFLATGICGALDTPAGALQDREHDVLDLRVLPGTARKSIGRVARQGPPLHRARSKGELHRRKNAIVLRERSTIQIEPQDRRGTKDVNREFLARCDDTARVRVLLPVCQDRDSVCRPQQENDESPRLNVVAYLHATIDVKLGNTNFWQCRARALALKDAGRQLQPLSRSGI